MEWVAGGVLAAVVVLGLMIMGLAQAKKDEAGEWDDEDQQKGLGRAD